MLRTLLGRPAAAWCAAALALSACGGAGRGEHAAAEPSGPILAPTVAAVVRGDGVIVPFVTFEAGTWTSPPDASIADRPEPWFAGRLDSLARWTLVTPLGLADARGRPLTIGVTGEPVEIGSHCQRVWGLPTDLPGRPTPVNEVHRTVGIALAGDVVPGVVAELNRISANDDRRALAYLAPRFEEAEAREAARRAGRDGYEPRPVGAAAAKTPLAFTRLHRVGRVDGVEMYLFEAARTYVPVRPDDCDGMTVMTGWLAEGPLGALSLIESEIALTDCDRKGSLIVQPMAALELGRHLFVFTVDLDYEGESYSVFQVSSNAVARALSVWGGGC